MNVRHKLDALTALRFFAAALIVMGHAHPIFGSFGLATSAPLNQGVSFFFVLSGFILAYNYRNFDKTGSIGRFLAARFARVWPLHLITCILWIGLVFHFNRTAYFPGSTGIMQLLANLTLTQSWIPLKLWAISFNGVAWSISNEMFFYIAFPLIIMCWRKHWATVLFIASASVAIFIAAGNHFNLSSSDNTTGVGLLGIIYVNPLTRIFEFIIGVAVANIFLMPALHEFKASKASWLYLELFALGLCTASMVLVGNPLRINAFFGPAAGYYLQSEGLWLIWGILILVFALSKGPVTAILSTRPLVFLGEISFALYLVHAIVLACIEPRAETFKAFGLAGYGMFWGIALLAAAALYKGVEDPCRHLIMNTWDKRHASLMENMKTTYGPTAIGSVLLIACALVAVRVTGVI